MRLDTGTSSLAVSPESLAAHRALPSRELTSSASLGWRSVLARSFADPVETDGFTTAITTDLLVVINMSGSFTMECQRPRGWSRVAYRPGAIGVTAPGTTSTLRWRGATPRPVSVHLHLSSALLRGAAEALGRPQLLERLPDSLLLEDPTVLALGRTLATGLRRGADPFYADSLAQALVVHLLHGRLLGGESAPLPAPPAPLAGPAVGRVLEHMQDHLAEKMTLDDLAAVSGVSQYQVSRAFKRAMGSTPHRYLVRLRMQRAAELLATDEYSVQHVAALCGYASRAQFIAAFGHHHGTSPARYRRARRSR